ncbi:GTPase HflX [Candidatus Stoquefichus massiliensis]|uniref:GTPase HflX n=1 Tax=Candidatus Stoquefichus massiliensis TaxID=1470350 RepID=UPI0004892C50|nr:GTPase HflX [Candidatus Stoquefichus massiliensis]
MKAILVGVEYDHMYYDLDISMKELKELSAACHIEVKDVLIQKLDQISPKYYIGKGKVEELKTMISDDDIVIFNEELSPLQVKNLIDALDVEVTDRSDLILRIFESRAQTKEAKLQVQIARNQYLLPRLAGMKEELYSQQGGSGFRGSGEKQIELDRRIIHRELVQARRELQTIVKQRQTQRQLRKRNQEKVVCLVGYTNSGKSSLLNYFTDKKVFEEDMLFASLQTASRQVRLKNHHIIMSDTVGFINQLPHHLVQAFRSTLEEVKEADLLLHVIDSSSSYCESQIETTLEVLEAIGVKDTPMIYVYNKVDKDRYAFLQPQEPSVFISIKDEVNLDILENMMIDMLFKDYELIELYIPYDHGEVYSDIKQHYEMIHEDYLENGIYVSFYVDVKDKYKYQDYLYLN